MSHGRDEVEEAYRHYVRTGLVNEDWVAWSRLFTDDAVYHDHYYGTFRGPEEIQAFLEGTMSVAPMVYTVLVWYVIDGDRIVYKSLNRADNPEPGGAPFNFPSLQIITYAGDGKWSAEEDMWTTQEMKLFAQQYAAAATAHDPDHVHGLSRADWGPWVDWARPDPGHDVTPSWLGRDDVVPIRSIRDITVGIRNPRP